MSGLGFVLAFRPSLALSRWSLRCAELAGQVQREKQQHQERQDALLNPAPREELLKERTRVEENITRLRKVRSDPCLSPSAHGTDASGACARQETDALKEQTIRAESCGSELSVREQSLWQQENVEVPRLRCAPLPGLALARPSPQDPRWSKGAVPRRRRHAISLYANISSIRWDYSSSKVKGFITAASGSGIKSFELVR